MTKDMTTGSPLKLILLFTIPVLLGNLFQQFYNMVDAVIVGQFLGADALAAVGSVSCLMFLVVGFANGIAQGFGVAVSHNFGAKDIKGLKHCVALSLMLTVIVSLILTIPTFIASKKLLLLLNTPDNIIEMADAYLKIIFAGIILTMSYNAAAGILRGIGDSKTPLYFLIFSSVLNIFLDIFLIVVVKLGTAGAAYATIISQGISALFCFIYMFRKYEILRVSREDFYFDYQTIKRILSIGIPMALNYSITAIGISVIQSAVNVFGSVVVAAFTAASKVSNIVLQLGISLGVTMSTYCGQNLGAKKYDRIFTGVRYSAIISLFIAAISAFICVVCGPFIVRCFIDHPTEEIMYYAMHYLKLISWFFVPLSWIFAYRNSLQGLNKGLVPMLSGFIELFARFVIIKLLTDSLGYTAACLADPLTWVVTALPLMVTYYVWQYQMKRKQGVVN